MPKKRRLTDLYVVGKELSFDDGEGEPITVFVRKLNPVDHETALRNANAARSRALALKTNVDNDDHLALATVVQSYSPEDLITYLVEDLKQNRAAVIEAKVADDDEWTKDHYLQGLKDAWDDELKVEWAKDPTHEDGARVKAELDRFQQQVDAELNGEVDDLRDELEDRPVDELRQKVLDKVIEVRASIAWLSEYRRCEVWLSVREPDRKTKYFENRKEVDELPGEVYEQLSGTYLEISVDVTEGKDSAATLPSSPSSEQPEPPATDESSGPTTAAA